jgi:hypothetical protein
MGSSAGAAGAGRRLHHPDAAEPEAQPRARRRLLVVGRLQQAARGTRFCCPAHSEKFFVVKCCMLRACCTTLGRCLMKCSSQHRSNFHFLVISNSCPVCRLSEVKQIIYLIFNSCGTLLLPNKYTIFFYNIYMLFYLIRICYFFHNIYTFINL